MYPTFKNKDIILIKIRNFNVETNAVYIVELQEEHYIIKRLDKVINYTDSRHNSIYKSYFFLGDNLDASIDSRTFGGVSRPQIKGKVNTILWRRKSHE